MAENIFFTPFENMNAYDQPPIVTELVRPSQSNFDFSKVGNFGSVLGSVFETGQTFRNVFNTSVSPAAIANMASAGLQTQLSELLSKNGFTKYFGNSIKTFNKTTYGYEDSEAKLNKCPNIELDFNPIGMFDSIVENLFDAIDPTDEDEKTVNDFYVSVNNFRKRIWELNGRIWTTTEHLRAIHSSLNRPDEILVNIFHTEAIYSERFSIVAQIRNMVFCVESYLVEVPKFTKIVQNKEDYEATIRLLKVYVSQMSEFMRYVELKHVYEDLKVLKQTPESEFKPIS